MHELQNSYSLQIKEIILHKSLQTATYILSCFQVLNCLSLRVSPKPIETCILLKVKMLLFAFYFYSSLIFSLDVAKLSLIINHHIPTQGLTFIMAGMIVCPE